MFIWHHFTLTLPLFCEPVLSILSVHVSLHVFEVSLRDMFNTNLELHWLVIQSSIIESTMYLASEELLM